MWAVVDEVFSFVFEVFVEPAPARADVVEGFVGEARFAAVVDAEAEAVGPFFGRYVYWFGCFARWVVEEAAGAVGRAWAAREGDTSIAMGTRRKSQLCSTTQLKKCFE